MRHAMLALGLALLAALPAAAQGGEIIIRRPGVPDRVISLDTAQARQQVKVLAGQLQKMAIDNQQQIRELTAKVAQNLEPLRVRTLAFTDSLRSREKMLLTMPRLAGLAARQPHLGIVVRTAADSDDRYGAYIQAVTPGSPAEKAGMLSGDYIVRIAGKSLTEKDGKEDSTPGLRLISIIATLPVGKPVDVELRRGSQTVNVKVTPTEDTSSAIAWTEMPSVTNLRLLPGQPSTGEISLRAMPTMPPSNLFSNGDMSFTINGMFGNDLFANLELTALNEKLGSYFGTSEGVLVVSTEAHRGFAVMATPAIVSGMPRDVVIRQRADSARRTQARAGPTGGAGMMIRRDTTITLDGEPTQTAARRTPFTMGLEPGDVILSVDGRKVTSPSQLMRIIGSYDHNDEFKLQIMRQKHQETLPVKMP